MKIKTAFIQFDVKHELHQNLKTIETLLNNLNCEIAVLPELCTCGYLFENKKELLKVAQPIPNSETVQIMQQLSSKHNCAIIFGMAELENSNIYNTAVIVDKGAYIGKYCKIHLTDFEKNLFNKGDINPIFEVCGVRVGVQICFDLWFPEISREQVLKGADLLCVLANFGGETTCDISRIRAIENLTPLVLCNRVGHESSKEIDATFLGKSTIILPDGTKAVQEQANTEHAKVSEIIIKKDKGNVICSDFTSEINIHYTK